MVTFAAPERGDIARNLVDEFRFDSLEQMRSAGLERSELPTQPWSGWFWPLKEGGLANRYADSRFPTDAPWETISNHLLSSIGRTPLNQLSPSEKYDLLLGDSNFTLTRTMIKNATNEARNGTIEFWIGYCTGWANAAMMMPRPRHSVVLTARGTKTQIEFRPDDIKALGALLWSTGSFPARTSGNLCRENPVQRDPITDRPLNPLCRDTNPATFHLAMVNQIGVGKRSLLIDSDPAHQVWNQPVQSYAYRYFNPITNREEPLERAKIPIGEFRNDRFAAFRTHETRYVVGVEMSLTFIYEKRPVAQSIDAPETDEKRFPIYRYDLELNSSGRIIGGEWHSRLHPDLLWVAERDSFPETMADALLRGSPSAWSPNMPIPADWARAAIEASKYAQPLGRIVAHLFNWSSR